MEYSFLFLLMQKLWKSITKCKTCSRKATGLFFLGHGVCVDYLPNAYDRCSRIWYHNLVPENWRWFLDRVSGNLAPARFLRMCRRLEVRHREIVGHLQRIPYLRVCDWHNERCWLGLGAGKMTIGTITYFCCKPLIIIIIIIIIIILM